MECPVCKSSGISVDSRKCPQCNADLEALLLLKKVEKSTNKWRTFGITLVVLLVLVVVGCILSFCLNTESGDDIQNVAEVEKFSDLKTELETSKNEVLKLKSKNNELSEQLAQIETKKAERVKSYIVQEGETLFSIARKVYGNGYKFVDLAKENQIDIADNIVVGQEIKIHY